MAQMKVWGGEDSTTTWEGMFFFTGKNSKIGWSNLRTNQLVVEDYYHHASEEPNNTPKPWKPENVFDKSIEII